MSEHRRPKRLALVIHPSRDLDAPLKAIENWAASHGTALVQLADDGGGRPDIAPCTSLEPGDLVIAVGGDGTVLSALRAAAPDDAPVMGVACGSLGALSTVSADDLSDALDRVLAGDWTARPLPALAAHADSGSEEWAINDVVVIRRGAGQVVAHVAVDGEPYVRLAGDGLIVATPAGSSGYTMAAGGPLLSAHTPAFVCTPLAMHGGCAPPLVVRADAALTVEIQPSYSGFDLEFDGHRRPLEGSAFHVTFHDHRVDLVTFSPTDQGLRRLRQRGLITDSPRVLARDQRAASE